MTEPLFLETPYLREAAAQVRGLTEDGGIILDRSLFYATGGGQPGDSGTLSWEGGACDVISCEKGDGKDLICVTSAGSDLPAVGTLVTMSLDWSRRYAHMRVHTALHLLSVAIPFGVTGGAITAGKGRLDFDMADPPADKEAISRYLSDLVASDAPVTEEWITEEELAARPDLVKTLTVKPPRGSGRIRLIRIAQNGELIDLQPCGGTHVASLSEIGKLRLGKVEKKGRMNRRVYLHLED